jgi:hypothetical protein
MFDCSLCGKIFSTKFNLERHQEKKNKCNIKSEYQCINCNSYFKYKKNLTDHISKQTCKDKKINKITLINNLSCNKKEHYISLLNSKLDIDSKINIIKPNNTPHDKECLLKVINSDMSIDDQINCILLYLETSQNSGVITNNNNSINNSNNNNNITNNIQINNFGQENLSYMDSEYFKNLIMNQHIEKGYVQLIKDIYLNKDHPENSTVKVENLNNKYAHIFRNNKWEAILKADLKEQLHKKNYTILKMHYDKLKKTMTLPKKEETRVFLQRDDFSDPHMMYVIDKIILLFYNDGEGEDMDLGKINKNIV